MFFQPETSTLILTKRAFQATYGFKWAGRPSAAALSDLMPPVVPVTVLARPDVPAGAKAVMQAAPTADDGDWTMDWDVVPMTEQEILDALPYKTADQAHLVMVGWINRLTSQILDRYPEAIKQRWHIEEAAARAYADATATAVQTALIEREAGAKGVAPADHAARITFLADQYRGIADQINTLMLNVRANLDAAPSPVAFPGILEAAIGQAAALAGPYNLSMEGV